MPPIATAQPLQQRFIRVTRHGTNPYSACIHWSSSIVRSAPVIANVGLNSTLQGSADRPVCLYNTAVHPFVTPARSLQVWFANTHWVKSSSGTSTACGCVRFRFA